MPSPLLHPGVYQEEVSGTAPIQAASTSITAFLGVTPWGPLGPTLITSFAEFIRRFGSYDSRSELAYAIEGYFSNGGNLAYIGRQVHYTDPALGTIPAVKASSGTNIQTAAGDASAAQVTGAGLPTYEFDPGDAITIDLDNAGPAPATFDAARAVRAGAGLAIVDLTGLTLIVAIDGGEQQTITFQGSDTTPALVAQRINDTLVGGSALVNGGQVDIQSDTFGSSSSVEVVGGTALTEIGHTAGTTASPGPNDVADINAVTFAEFKAVLEADIAGLLVTQDGTGNIVLTSPTTGPTSEIDITAAAAKIIAATGLAVGVTNGGAAATQHSATITAKYYGLRGNDVTYDLAHNPVFPSAGAGSDMNADASALDTTIELSHAEGLRAGVVIKITDGVNTEYREITSISKAVVGAAVVTTVGFATGLVNGYTAAASTVESLEFDVTVYVDGGFVEQWSQLSMLDTADNYAETVINDESTGSDWIDFTDEDAALGLGADRPAEYTGAALSGATDEAAGLVDADIIGAEIGGGGSGVHLFDSANDASLLSVPGRNSVAVFQSMLEYCEQRLDMFYVGGCAAGLDRDAIKSFRQDQGGFDSSYGAMYWPRIKVLDPAGAGSSPRKTIDPAGHIAGVFARVDSIAPPDGGVWSSPAGLGDFGRIRGALELETLTTDGDQDVLNPIAVNVLRRFKNAGISIYGARTLSSNVKWRYINVRRLFIFIEKSIVESTRADVFRNNDFRLWGRLRDKINEFLRGLWQDGAMPGRTTEESYFVTIDETTTTPADVVNGRVNGEIGVRPQRPAEFIVFRFSQFDGGSSVTEQ